MIKRAARHGAISTDVGPPNFSRVDATTALNAAESATAAARPSANSSSPSTFGKPTPDVSPESGRRDALFARSNERSQREAGFFHLSGRRDSNPRRRPWQGRTLPLSYSRGRSVYLSLVARSVKFRTGQRAAFWGESLNTRHLRGSGGSRPRSSGVSA